MTVTIHTGDVLSGLAKIESGTVQTCVTSPPYWGLRDYGVDGQIGLESSPDEYVAKMVAVFSEVRRCLRDDGTLWLNLGDSYASNWGMGAKRTSSWWSSASGELEGKGWGDVETAIPPNSFKKGRADGLKVKDLCMMPWRVALALQADGWWLRSVIVWAKKSPMPESVTDRPTSSWEPIFLLAKSSTYFYDAEAVKEASGGQHGAAASFARATKDHLLPGQSAIQHRLDRNTTEDCGTRNQRNVWHLSPESYSEAHFATFPTEIPRRCILAGTSEKGQCPACGAGWVRVVERSSMVIAPSGRDGRISGNGQRSTSGAMVEPPRSMTTGWEPSCSCNAGDPVPQIVLEPFLGSGTTLAVASQLGRRGVGCELNPEYVKLAQDRIGRATRPNTYQSDKAVDAPLFGATNA